MEIRDELDGFRGRTDRKENPTPATRAFEEDFKEIKNRRRTGAFEENWRKNKENKKYPVFAKKSRKKGKVPEEQEIDIKSQHPSTYTFNKQELYYKASQLNKKLKTKNKK